MYAVLALKDGTILKGKGFGAEKESSGEIVFNTSMVGYEESLTDPSYKGQILTFTYPLIGNYGVRNGFFESDSIQAEGLVVREHSEYFCHRKAVKSIHDFLREHDVPAISNVDTRAITKKLRDHGVMNACLAVSKKEIDEQEVLEKAKKLKDISEFNLLEKVSVKQKKEFNCKGDKTIAIIDFGIKNSIIGWLLNKKLNVVLLPYNAKPQEILDLKPDGLLLGNGPGNPGNAKDAINVIKELYGQMPVFGICLGHQIIGLALGAKTYKLKFGHHGSNQPIKDLQENKVYITSQNHNYVVDETSCEETDLKVNMINLNDKSVEGVCNKKAPLYSVQFHPEAGPGPLDSNNIFEKWLKILK